MSELTKNDIAVRDIEINEEGTGVSAYIETWFDVDKKFGTKVANEEDTWINFYAEYLPQNDDLKCTYIVDGPHNSEEYSYIPTSAEKELIISLMNEACERQENCSLSELINKFSDSSEITMI